jgi:hypothetical protein
MASKHQKRSSSALDPLMAGFAAGAAAFIIYAMPQARFDEAVSLSGLPMIVSAAQPPLGMTARLAAMAAAGIGSFVLVWLVLRALSKPAPKPKHRSGLVEIDPPRLRRADANPDAPSRRPILAGVDLGRPFDEMPISGQDPFEHDHGEEDQPLDALLADEEQAWDRRQDDEEAGKHEVAADAEQYVDHYIDPYETAFAPQPAPEPSLEEEPEQSGGWRSAEEAEEDELAFDEFGQAEEEQELAGTDFGAEFEPPSAEDTADFVEKDAVSGFPLWQEPAEEEPFENVPLDLLPREVQSVHALSDRLADDDDQAGSIPDLMERLEAGLRRRQPTSWHASAPDGDRSEDASAAIGETSPQLDSRLRGAIDELQKLAARGR